MNPQHDLDNQIDKQLKTMLVKNTDFFGDRNRYVKFEQDEATKNAAQILDVELECLAYGHFYPERVYNRVQEYCQSIMDKCPNLKSFKLIFNGFDMKLGNFFHNLCKGLKNKTALRILWIHSNQLKNCSFQFFKQLMTLMEQLGNDKNLQDFSLQCSHWKFEKQREPTMKTMQSFFISFIEQNKGIGKLLDIKRFRMQISGWFMDKQDAKRFLFANNVSEAGQQRTKIQVEQFHNLIKQMVQGFLDCMENVNLFQLDMRDWHQVLSMKELQKKLSNVKRDKRSQPSYISKRQQLYYDDQDKKNQLVTSFMM